MSKTFRTQGAGSSQTLHEIEDEKIPVYDTKAEADADLANLAEGQIVATKDGSVEDQNLIDYVDSRLETTTTEITMDMFKTGSKAQLYKSGNNVQLRYWAEGDISTFNPIARETNVLIGTIPDGFRPKQKLVFNTDGNCPNNPDYASTLVTIETNGGIYIWVFGQNPLPPNFGINIDYNVDGTNSHGMTYNTLKDAKDYTDARAVRKFNYTMNGTDNVYNDIKALCGQLVALGVNTYAGSFLRTAKTHGYYSITVSQASGTVTLNGTVVVDNEQGRTNSYTVSRVNNDWKIMPAMLNNNIHAVDCNAVINPGIYNIDNTTTNTPYTGCYGILESKGFNPDIPSNGAQWIYQSVLDTSGRKFVRHCINPNTLSPISSQWSTWQEEDVLTEDLIVENTPGINGYLTQIKHFLINVDWSRIDNAQGYRREFVGSMEMKGYWYGTYELSCFGLGYKLMSGTIYGEGNPVRFSAWYDINWSTGWRISLSYNYTYVDISGQTYIGNLNEQLSTALNLVAPQTWDVQHCDCNIEVLGYFYAMGTYDRRGSYASFSGTILSSNQSVNGQTFTAEFEVTRNYWKCHNIILTNMGSGAIDGNSNIYLGTIMGTNDCEIISVRGTDRDIPIIPAKNISGQWYARATNWDGSAVPTGTIVTLEIKFRLL